jgi:hypothetical protein
MKLKLESTRDISILLAEGPITPENFAVLRAGIKKLFKDGKNKIILEVPDSGTFTPDLLREMATLNLTAAELAGSIVLAKIAPMTRAKIEAFSKPPVVRSFPDRDTAIEFFYPKLPEELPKAAPAAPALSPPSDVATPAGAAIDDKAKLFKTEIRTKELGDLGTVRKKLSELEAENAELKGRIAEIIVTRREPPDVDAWKEKVSLLEKQLAEAIKTAQDAAAPKK